MKYSLHPSVPTPHLSFKFRTGPASTPFPETKTRKGHREAARIGTDGEAQNTWRLPCAPHRGHRRIRARFLLYACRISRSAALHPKRTPHRTSFPERRICQPSFNAAGAGNPLWHNYPTPVIQFIPFLHLCQRFSFSYFTYLYTFRMYIHYSKSRLGAKIPRFIPPRYGIILDQKLAAV